MSRKSTVLETAAVVQDKRYDTREFTKERWKARNSIPPIGELCGSCQTHRFVVDATNSDVCGYMVLSHRQD